MDKYHHKAAKFGRKIHYLLKVAILGQVSLPSTGRESKYYPLVRRAALLRKFGYSVFPECTFEGTWEEADFVAYNPVSKRLYISDTKTGYYPIPAENNKQLLRYAALSVLRFSPPRNAPVVMSIFAPECRSSIPDWVMTAGEILDIYNEGGAQRDTNKLDLRKANWAKKKKENSPEYQQLLEKKRERENERYHTNKKEVCAKNRQRLKDDPEYAERKRAWCRKSVKKLYDANPEKYRTKKRVWYRKNRNAVLARRRELLKDPERMARHRQRCREATRRWRERRRFFMSVTSV